MDERAADFVEVFQTFLEEVVHQQRRAQSQDGPGLVPVLHDHLGTDPRRLPVVTEEIPSHLFIDLDVALSEIQLRSETHQVLGIGGGSSGGTTR